MSDESRRNESGCSNTPISSPKKSQVDFMEIISVISKSYKLIVFFTMIFMLVAFSTTLSKQQVWESYTIVSPNTDGQYQSLSAINSTFSALNVNSGITEDTFNEIFSKYFYSQYNFNKFSNDVSVKNVGVLVVSQLVGDVNAINYIDNKFSYILTYSSLSGDEMKNVLTEYVNYTAEQVRSDFLKKIESKIDIEKDNAREQYDFTLRQAENAHLVRVNQLENAISIANKLGLKKADKNLLIAFSQKSNNLVFMGGEALSRQLEIEKSIKDLSTVDAVLLNKKLYLDKINALQPVIANASVFNYIQKPSNAVLKVNKEGFLIVTMFGIIGFISSIGFVLARHYIREQKISSSQE